MPPRATRSSPRPIRNSSDSPTRACATAAVTPCSTPPRWCTSPYLKFLNGGQLRAEDRRAFFAYASSVMRSVIIDTVRQRQAERHGGQVEQVTLVTQLVNSGAADTDVLRVHEALDVLAQAEPRLAQVVEMRYFGGYTEQEIAEALDLTERTVRRDWDKARLLLSEMLKS